VLLRPNRLWGVEVAKRLECVRLAGAFRVCQPTENGSKLRALQTLRAAWSRDDGSNPLFSFRFEATGEPGRKDKGRE
jgi:hypothetical protein